MKKWSHMLNSHATFYVRDLGAFWFGMSSRAVVAGDNSAQVNNSLRNVQMADSPCLGTIISS